MQDRFSFLPIKNKNKNKFSFLLYDKVPLVIFIISTLILLISIIIQFNRIPLSLVGLFLTPILTTLFVILNNINTVKNKNEFILDLLIDEIGHNLLILHENENDLELEREFFKLKQYHLDPSFTLKLDWKYSLNTLTSNPFKKIIGIYNAFVYDFMRYNENIKYRNTMPIMVSTSKFLDKRKRNNYVLQRLGEFSRDKLISILKKLGSVSIATSKTPENKEENKIKEDIIKQLKQDGFTQKQIDQAMNYHPEILKDIGNYYLIYFYYDSP